MRSQLLLLALLGCGAAARPTTAVKDREPDHATSTAEREPVVVEPVGTTTVAASVQRSNNQCDNLSVSEMSVDGLLDDWKASHVLARIGAASDGSIEVHCAWDGQTLGLAFDIKDDRVIRVKGGHEDHVAVKLRAGGRPVEIVAYPGNAMAKPKIAKPANVVAADSLQPDGFSLEIAIPASSMPGYSESTPRFELEADFVDADTATGAQDEPLHLVQKLELGDRHDLLDDFLTALNLRKSDIRSDTLIDLDPDRKGRERLVVAGTAIGVLTDRYAYVTLPAASAAAVKSVKPMALGRRGQQVIVAVVRQEDGSGGARDLLMLWTVWSGQLQPLVNIEIEKRLGDNVVTATWRIVKGKKGAELVVEPGPVTGFTQETWNEVPAGDADSIVLPWDATRSGVAYTLNGAEIARRDLPPRRPAKKR